MATSPDPRIWGLIPAAGTGRRFGGQAPKQYWPLTTGVSVLATAIRALHSDPRIQNVMVAVAAEDTHWPESGLAEDPGVRSCTGGESRAESVLRGLRALRDAGATDRDWVAVHDAARPGLPREALTRLLDEVLGSGEAALLALPVPDSLKRSEDGEHISENLGREGVWIAQTPQIARLGDLVAALESVDQEAPPTDEAAALSASGLRIRLVTGARSNLKITYPEDLDWINHLLQI